MRLLWARSERGIPQPHSHSMDYSAGKGPTNHEEGRECSLATVAGARVNKFDDQLASCRDLDLQGPNYEMLHEHLALRVQS